jgi:hypothetical protein
VLATAFETSASSCSNILSYATGSLDGPRISGSLEREPRADVRAHARPDATRNRGTEAE